MRWFIISEENKTVELEDKELKQVTGGTVDSAGSINIKIRSLNGGVFSYTVNLEITIYDLKLLYTEYEGYVTDVRFAYNNKELLDNSGTLASYNVANGAVIYSVGNWQKSY